MLFDAHTHHAESRTEAIAIRNVRWGVDALPDDGTPPPVMLSIGIHPWDVASDWQNQLAPMRYAIEARASHTVVAIGEIGLDTLCRVPMERQREAFVAQIATSEDLGKPVVVHCVRAHGELVPLRRRLQPRQPWIVHGFARNVAIATECIEAGMYLSFGAAIITNAALRPTVQSVPLDRVLLETDDGTRTIAEVYAAFAGIRRMDAEAVQRTILHNAQRVFGDFVG